MSSLAAAASNGTVSPAVLARSPLKSRHPLNFKHTTTSTTAAASAPLAAQEPDEDSGITREELQTSYLDKLTQDANPGKMMIGPGKLEGNMLGLAASIVAFFPSVVVRGASMFKVYLKHISMVVTTAVVVLLACSLRGDVTLFVILMYKSYQGGFDLSKDTGYFPTDRLTPTDTNATDVSNASIALESKTGQILPDYLQLPASYNLTDLLLHLSLGVVSSELMYHFLCGFLQLYYYEMQRNQPEKWKCQPHRFLTRSNELHEIVVGTINLVIAGGISGFLSCWILNGNYSTVYFSVDEYGYPYLIFSVVWVFVWLEAAAYYSHALLHSPWLYKNIHKHHHRYHSPTAYSVIAMSPFELIFYDCLFITPLFLLPVHGLVYVAVLVYVFYFGLMDHSGIKMESWFPWQPDTMFHDNHHRYFHCNFGFNASWFDRLHGTMRRKDRLYGEKVFGGKGMEK